MFSKRLRPFLSIANSDAQNQLTVLTRNLRTGSFFWAFNHVNGKP